MNSQREEQNKRMDEIESQIAEGYMSAGRCFTQMKQMVQSAWQAATEQGVGEAVAWREYTVQPAESLAGIAVRQLGNESRAGEIGLLNNLVWEDVGLYPFNPGDVIKLPVTHPPKPTGGCVPDGWHNSASGEYWPNIGELYLICIGPDLVLQNEIYEFDQGDDGIGGGEYFWSRDDIDECPAFNSECDLWIALRDVKAPLATQQPPEQESGK